MPKRKYILFGLLVLTLAATFWVTEGPQPAAQALPSARQAKPSQPGATITTAVASPVLPLYKLERPAMIVSDMDPFGVKSWYTAPPPPPPAPAPAAPPAPVAPTLPFTYAGRLQDGSGRWTFYLTRGDQSFAVSKGDTFDTSYKLESIDNGILVIEYLPLSVKQTLPIVSES